MKQFAIAALLSQASAAPSGCKGTLKGERFSDSSCKKDSKTGTFNFYNMDNKKDSILEGTGKCVPHKPDDKYVKNAASLKTTFDEAHGKTAAEKATLTSKEQLIVCNKADCSPSKKETVAVFFGDKYDELLKKYTTWQEADDAYTAVLKGYTDPVKKEKVVAYKAAMVEQAEQKAEIDYTVANAASGTATPFDQFLIADMMDAHLTAQKNALPTMSDEDMKVVLTAVNTESDAIHYLNAHFIDKKHLVTSGTEIGENAPNKQCASVQHSCPEVKKSDGTCADSSVGAADKKPNPLACTQLYTKATMKTIVTEYVE